MDRKRSAISEGLLLGAIGYVAVAVFYSILDVLAGRDAVFTLNLMGKVVFRGARDPAILQLPIPADVGAMVAYNFLHLGIALAVGLFVAWLVHRVEEQPKRGVPAAVILLAGFLITILAVRAYTFDVAPLLPFWSIVVVNTLVALGGAVYLWIAHPGLWAKVRGAGSGPESA